MTDTQSFDKEYYLLLIDIKGSTSLTQADRAWLFAELEQKLDELNHHLVPKPVVPLAINYGDEVAGVFDSPALFYQIVASLRETMYPVTTFRFAATYGQIGITSTDIKKVGGKVFKEADKYIGQLKKKKNFCWWALKDNSMNASLNVLTEMSNALLERMTEYQRTVCRYLAAGFSQKQIAEKLEKHPQSVSNAVRKSSADKVVNAGKVITDLLKRSAHV